MSDEASEVEVKVEWPYGLGKIEFIDDNEVTDENRLAAMEATRCECLELMDKAVSELSPGFRRYGGTLRKVVDMFTSERKVIEEEMSRIARRNLQCVVTGHIGGRRVLNFELAVAEKEARDALEDKESSVGEEKTPLGFLDT